MQYYYITWHDYAIKNYRNVRIVKSITKTIIGIIKALKN